MNMKFKIADEIYHKKFGKGKILGITPRKKENYLNIKFYEHPDVGILSIRDNDKMLVCERLNKIIEKIKNEIKTKDYISMAEKNKLYETYKLDIDHDTIFDLVEEHNKPFVEKKLKAEIEAKNYISITENKKLYEIYKSNIDYGSLKNSIEQHNIEFMKEEIRKYPDVFTTKDKKPLNEEQNLAVVSDEDNCLVIAGAGCGKTSMLLSKIKYLLQKGVPTDKILVLSYTKKTVEDFNTSLKEMDIHLEARTFHSLGLMFAKKQIAYEMGISEKSIKCDDQINISSIFRKILDSNQKDTIEIKIKEENEEKIIKIENRNNIFKKIKKLFLNLMAYNTDNKNDVTDTSSNVIKAIKTYAIANYELQSFPTLKSEIKYFEGQNKTINGGKVKSLAEVKIANFLFLNGIEYEYEKEYEKPYYGENITNKQYNPDFYIKTGENEGIWLEHFGITTDKQGNKHAYWCNEEEKYLRQMEEKIQTHKNNGTRLIYTTSDMLHDGTLISELEKILKESGIKLNPISDDVIQEYLEKLLQMQKYQRLIDRVERAINLFKGQNRYVDIQSWQDAVNKNTSIINILDFKYIFLIISHIYEIYQEALHKNHSIDFNDMISKAIDIIKTNKDLDITGYDYILVDEYQDITNMRYEFIKALKEVNNAKVLAVGDDWQSIYGFGGSDISLFTNFSDFFDNVKELYITQTYRNPQQLLDVTQKFIEKNKAQTHKMLSSKSGDDKYPIKAILYHKSKKDTNNVQGCDTISSALARALDDILAKKKDNETVCIIGRYNIYTPNKYYMSNKSENEIYYDTNKNKTSNQKETSYQIFYQGQYFDFTTIHKAKGLEWDYTIFLDGIFDEEGTNSFPCALPDDYIVKPLLHCTDTYEYAEERRMLYVALTRCKKQCYWLISEEKPTPFYEKELKPDIQVINDTFEEYCKKTHKIICPECKNGFLIERVNPRNNTKFLGCTSYPLCKHTESINKSKNSAENNAYI